MKFKSITFIFILIVTSALLAQVQRPKLVVGVVIDQMRFNDLYRYYHLYGEDGFKRLAEKGSNFTFAHYNYELTSTGPDIHQSIQERHHSFME